MPLSADPLLPESPAASPVTELHDCSYRTGCGEDTAIKEINTAPSAPIRVSLVDNSHRYVTRRFDGVAQWFDGFFGDKERERESAHSIVRLKYHRTLFEGGARDDKLRLRGKVRLPQVNKRLNLVFSDEEEGDVSQPANNSEFFADEQSQSIALQLDVRRSRTFKLDHRIGFRSGTELKVGSRARVQQAVGERWKIGLSEELYWQDTVGFGSRSIFDFDYVYDPHRLARWRNRIDYSEKSRGVEWLSSLSFSQAFREDRAVSYYLRAYGYTHPEYLTRGYGPGLVYRQSFLKRWLFWEIEPEYRWVRELPEDRREGVASITFRLEVVFGKQYLH